MYSFYSRIAYLKKQRQLAFIARHIRALGVLSLLGVVLILVLLRAQADSFYAGGTGTREDPYQIATCEQLQEMRQNLSSFYILINDIDCQSIVQGVGWEPVGKGFPSVFSGVLDGQNHTVTNFGITRATSSSPVGLFGTVEGALIKNLLLDKGYIVSGVTGGDYTGALVGMGQSLEIQNVGSNIPVYVSSPKSYIGGLVGVSWGNLYIKKSYTNASVSASSSSYIGGLVGRMNGGLLLNSYSSGSVVGGSRVGGLVGETYGVAIRSSFSSSGITITGGANTAGGLVGSFKINYYGTDNYPRISSSFATGHITGSGGALIGSYTPTNDFANIENSYFDQTGTGKTSCVASPSLTSSSTACEAVNTDGLSPNYFYASTSAPLSSWDFTHTWIEHASSTPHLSYYHLLCTLRG